MKNKEKILYSDDFFGSIPEKYLGRKINTFLGMGTVAKMKNGFIAPRVSYKCHVHGCKIRRMIYLGRGAAGPDQKSLDYYGNYLGDNRDQVFVCEKHGNAEDTV